MKKAGRYTGYSLLMLLGYMFVGFALTGGSPTGAVLVGGALTIVHAVFGFLTSLGYFAQKKPDQGKAMLLSTLVMLVIGVSLCLGGGTLG
ncbi:hypothetical protein SAMN05421823_104129 [Catalinimonas alkaloidigena]|uniref:Uncharacterized protein n=1 Tax=Catalinimonas alkaloidigena TaxID=1075417 RepID=A0A1G9GJA1_9BACT|nr:hypothetical protein [Catalinimonas alkaloidigena]SDL00749.1 hypothetical protein SAMN05421823_104129 [Catalinimonas alkaloidigena]